jgi:hypothetical protein
MSDARSGDGGHRPLEASVPPHARFTAIAAKPHAQIAGELAEAIKGLIYAQADRVPLALAIGVLRIVEKEILDAQENPHG